MALVSLETLLLPEHKSYSNINLNASKHNPMIKAANSECQFLPQILEIPFLRHFLKSLILPMAAKEFHFRSCLSFPHCCEDAHDDSIEYSHLHQASPEDPLVLSDQLHPIQCRTVITKSWLNIKKVYIVHMGCSFSNKTMRYYQNHFCDLSRMIMEFIRKADSAAL